MKIYLWICGWRKNFLKKKSEKHFFMPHLRMGQTNYSLKLFKWQLMKLKFVLLKLMTTIFLQLTNQWYKKWVGTHASKYLDILEKIWIIFNYKIFKLTFYKLGLIPSSLGSKHKTAWSNCVTISFTKRLEFFWEIGFLIIKVATLWVEKKSIIIIFKE